MSGADRGSGPGPFPFKGVGRTGTKTAPFLDLSPGGVAAVGSAIGLGAVAAPAPPPPASDPAWPAPALARAALALLMGGAIVSQLDRHIINLVVEPIKAEFQLSDTQFGMLQGIAFGMFYTFMTLPIGMLADRVQRRAVIGVGVALFGLFAMATGFARSYLQLFLARVGVGVGEASVYPAGFSIITDYFPPDRLGRAISLFTASSMIGSGLALVGGGVMIGWLEALQTTRPDLLFGMQPWQLAFVFVALPGLLLAPCFFLLREPIRRGLALGRAARLPAREVLHELWRLRAFMALMLGGFSMVTTVSYAISIWTPAFFIRVHHWSPMQVGVWVGALTILCATPGGYVAGWLVDRLRARGVGDAPLKVAAFGFVGVGITGGLAPLMPTPALSLALLAPTLFFQSMPYACAPTALQLIVPNQLRSQVSAIYLTFITLVGLCAGPVVVGLFTDRLFSGPADVRYSLALVVAGAAPIMFVLVLLSCGPYRRLLRDRAAALHHQAVQE